MSPTRLRRLPVVALAFALPILACSGEPSGVGSPTPQPGSLADGDVPSEGPGDATRIVLEPIVRDADLPTNLAPVEDGSLLYTEKETGRVRRVDPDGDLDPDPVAELAVVGDAERGLLGIALDPAERWIYLYLSDAADGRNRVVRIPSEGGRPETILDGLPSETGYHNGGDIAFGPDGMLYVVTGDAHDADLAQDPDSVGGKLLRLEPDGSIPEDNPDPASPVFASGIRNSFGVCLDPTTGQVWETENGPDRDDEVNRVPPGANLGWPVQLGPGGSPRFVDPVLVYPDVIVPTGCTVTEDGTVFFGDLSGSLHRVRTRPDGTVSDEIVMQAPGGIVDVARSADGNLLVATLEAILRGTLSPSGA